MGDFNEENFKIKKYNKKRTYKKKKIKSKREDFKITKNTIHIFTDGSAQKNPGICGSACILLYNEHRKSIKRNLGMGTSNIAELTAIKIGLEAVKPSSRCTPIIIYTDSKYCIGMLGQNWKARKNSELIKEIKEFMKKFRNIKFQKVKAHFGHKYNEEADILAKKASGVI